MKARTEIENGVSQCGAGEVGGRLRRVPPGLERAPGRPERVSACTADVEGRGLTVTIRIGTDGRVYFQDIPAALVGVALAMDPGNEELRARAELAARFERSIRARGAALDVASGRALDRSSGRGPGRECGDREDGHE